MNYKIVLLLGWALLGAPYIHAQLPGNASRQPQVRGDRFTLKFSVIKYFVFIEGEVNGVKGKFMFDTGSERAITLNTHFVHLPGGTKTGRGFVGSGQSYDTYRYDTVRSVRLAGGASYRNVGPIQGNDQRFIEPITPDYLGLLGHNFFQGYLFKLDYKRHLLTFYRDTPARRAVGDFLKGEQLVATLEFATRRLPNQPIIQAHLGGQPIVAAFDTGQLGGLYLAEERKRALLRAGVLRLSAADTTEGALKGLQLPDGQVVDIEEIAVLPIQDAAAKNKALGLTEPNTLDLGYGLLRQYKTVWDYPKHQIYLLRR